MAKKSSIRLIAISALIVSIPLVTFMLEGLIIAGDDTIFHLSRIRSIATEFQFPIYMFPDWNRGLGSPAAIFYPSLFFYVPAIFWAIEIPRAIVFDGFLISLIFFAGFFSYLGFRRILKSKFLGGIAASIYISQGYFLFDLYSRCALGEVLAMIFLPLAISFLISIPREKIFQSVLIFSAILESHILTAAITLPFLIRFNWKILAWILGLNAFFIVPFCYEYFSIDVLIKYIYTNPLSEKVWEISSDKFLNSIGLIGILILIGAIFERGKIFWISFSLSILFAIMSTEFFPWNFVESIFPSVTTIQFPWRFMMFYSITSSIAAAIILDRFFTRKFLIIVLCILNSIFASINCFKIDKPFFLIENNPFEILCIDYASSDIGFEQFYRWRDGIDSFVDSRITSVNHTQGKTIIEFKDVHGFLTLPILYYEGYEVRDESGKILPIRESPKHLIEVEIESGSKIEVEYRGLILFDVATTISLVTLIIFIWRWKKCRSE